MSRIRSFFESTMFARSADPEVQRPDIKLAACAMLLELAHADDSFTEGERLHLRGAISRQFGLDAAQADELIELADRARSEATDPWQFTSLVREHYSSGQKMVLLEMMWGLVNSDGKLAGKEEYLVGKIGDLLGVDPGYMTQIRRQPHDIGRSRGAVD